MLPVRAACGGAQGIRLARKSTGLGIRWVASGGDANDVVNSQVFLIVLLACPRGQKSEAVYGTTPTAKRYHLSHMGVATNTPVQLHRHMLC